MELVVSPKVEAVPRRLSVIAFSVHCHLPSISEGS